MRHKQDTSTSTPSLTSTLRHSPGTPKTTPSTSSKSSPVLKRSQKSPSSVRKSTDQISEHLLDTVSDRPRGGVISEQPHQHQSGNSDKPMFFIHASLENPQFQFGSQDREHLITADQVSAPTPSTAQYTPLVETRADMQRMASPARSESSQNDTYQSVGSSPVVSPTTSQTQLNNMNGTQESATTSGDEGSGRHSPQPDHQLSLRSQSEASVVARPVRRYETLFSKAQAK